MYKINTEVNNLNKFGITGIEILNNTLVQVIESGSSKIRRYEVTDNRDSSITISFKYRNTQYEVSGIEYNPTEDIKIEVESPTGEKIEIDFSSNKPVQHYQFNTIKTCINNDIPVYLVGEAGTGKNFTLQEIAKDLDLEFYFTNSVQQEYKLTGFIDAGGVYHETEFYKAFTQGGLFFLDEIDASIPEVLVLLNAAIANRYFEFPNGRVDAHPEFRVVAAGNTVGSGANELYTGRLVLDAATLDRFVIIEFDYDKNIELSLTDNNEHLVNFVRSLRKFSKENGIRATFSYRCLSTVTKLERAGLPLKQILLIAVLKGLDKDTIRTLKVSDSGKYFYALRDLQTA